MAIAPALVERLSWSAERLACHREAQLRRLLQGAIERSPWHRRRLSLAGQLEAVVKEFDSFTRNLTPE